jgi:hypothetical protein
MAALVCLSQSVLTPLLPVWAVLLSGIAIGAISYALLIMLLMRNLLSEASQLLPARLALRLERAIRWLPGGVAAPRPS